MLRPIVGATLAVVLPALGIWFQNQYTVLRGNHAAYGAVILFVVAGIVVGFLWHSEWVFVYIATLGVVWFIIAQATYPDDVPDRTGPVGSAIIMALLIMATMVGAAVGLLAGMVAER